MADDSKDGDRLSMILILSILATVAHSAEGTLQWKGLTDTKSIMVLTVTE